MWFEGSTRFIQGLRKPAFNGTLLNLFHLFLKNNISPPHKKKLKEQQQQQPISDWAEGELRVKAAESKFLNKWTNPNLCYNWIKQFLTTWLSGC